MGFFFFVIVGTYVKFWRNGGWTNARVLRSNDDISEFLIVFNEADGKTKRKWVPLERLEFPDDEGDTQTQVFGESEREIGVSNFLLDDLTLQKTNIVSTVTYEDVMGDHNLQTS